MIDLKKAIEIFENQNKPFKVTRYGYGNSGKLILIADQMSVIPNKPICYEVSSDYKFNGSRFINPKNVKTL